MILTIDIENTNIIIGCFEKGSLAFIESISTNTAATSLEYMVSFKSILEMHDISADMVDGGIVSSVVPSLTLTVRSAAEAITGKEIIVIEPGIKTGLSILIDDPGQLGSNLVAGAVAGIALYKAPMIIVDMGTATTFSVINEKKAYIGGLIMPGVLASLESLISRTSLLSNISLMPPKKIIATNTQDCLKSGIINSTASSIDGVVARIEEELGMPCSLIATGETAKVIIPHCSSKIVIDDDLLLKGLMLIYEKNR